MTITPYRGLVVDMRATSKLAVCFLHNGSASDTGHTEPRGDVKVREGKA